LKKQSTIAALIFLSLSISSANGAEPLLETYTSWDGGALAYPEGKARVTSVILHVEPDVDPPFHCHPIPTMGYVLRGTLEVTTEHGDTHRFNEGDAVVEVMTTLHRGRAIDGPVDIVVFYAGAEGVPTTVLPNTKDAATWPCGGDN
jgi:quercetin dioxygenase-like cupin family protein